MKKSLILYFVILVLFGLGILLTLEQGRHLQPRPRSNVGIATPATTVNQPAHPSGNMGPASIWSALAEQLNEPLSRLFVQLLAILLVSRLMGMLFTRIGQPAVVGEMFAGILLGPSLFGLLFPEAYQFIFPAGSLATVKLFSQIGVCLFMFAVGMELDIDHLRNEAHTALLLSHASILIPYFVGVLIALPLFATLAGDGTSFISFALFMGISMSITAFPVLARILQERRMEQTPLGKLAIICAAVGDVTAWCLLVFVVTIVRSGDLMLTLVNLGVVLVYVGLMVWLMPRRLGRWFEAEKDDDQPGKTVVTAVLVFAFASALATELMGIHALFGAFLAGVVMPPSEKFRSYLRVRIESFSSVFLLPLFFAFTGLRTQIGLLNDAENLAWCAFIIVAATFGKLGGTMFIARLTGSSWHDSFALGALMNTRGLMELIAINIGYDLGILSPQIFAMLVIMALTTTFMTGPLLTLAERFKRRATVMAPV